MSVVRFAEHNLDYRYYVYSLFCIDSGGAGYVKFGFSRRIDKRLSQIRTSCPIPIEMVGLLEVRIESRQKAVEKALHKRFSDRKVRGEWFSFDFSSKDDKREFKEGCQEAFAPILRACDDQYWSTIDVSVIDAIAEKRKKHYLSLPERYKKLARANAERRRAVTYR